MPKIIPLNQLDGIINEMAPQLNSAFYVESLQELTRVYKLYWQKPMPDTAAYAPGNKASTAAAAKQRPKLTKNRGLIYSQIITAEDYGITCHELSQQLDIIPSTVRPRCTELRDAGLIADSGRTRENGNGSPETVWVLA